MKRLGQQEGAEAGKRRRTSSRLPPPLTLQAIRAANPELDTVQGPRAPLPPVGAGQEVALALDAAADGLCASEEALQLYSVDASPSLLAAALRAGFFAFGSEFEYPGRGLADRGLLNLELAGPEREPQGEEVGGRIVLDLSEGSSQRLIVGKRAAATVRPATGASGSGFRYRLSVNSAFERSWQACVDAHGTDWLGFREIRASYLALHQAGDGGRPDQPRVLSIELWDEQSGELVSAEVGCLVGCCYTCLSLFAATESHPRCDQVRAQAAVLWLRKAGVQLFDAGTTAGYFVQLFGFRRTTKAEFLSLWRGQRGRALAEPAVLEAECADLRALLDSARGGGRPPSLEAASAAAAPAAAGVARKGGKPSVRVEGLPEGTDDAALAAAFAQATGHAVQKATVVRQK